MKKQILIPFLALAGLVFTVGGLCSPSLTPQPTETPLPPTKTFTPQPTNTPTTTPDYRATQNAIRVEEIQKQLRKIDMPTDSCYLGWYQEDTMELVLEGWDGMYWDFATDLEASDFVIYTEITWVTNSWPICGVWFRMDDRGGRGDHYAFYTLRFSGLPAYDIEYHKNGDFLTNITEKVRYSDYISNDSGATNRIMLTAEGNKFQIYINGNYEGRYYDYSNIRSSGQFAIVAQQNSGDTTCSFDNIWIWVYR